MPSNGSKQSCSRRDLLRFAGIGVGLGLATAALGDFSADDLEVTHAELRLPDWDAEGFRIAVIADLHANTAEESLRAQEAARLAVEAKPDAILVPGDFLNRKTPAALAQAKAALEPLHQAKCPVLGTLGNHDYACGNTRALIEMLHRSPVRILRNEAVEVRGVTIAGVDDVIGGQPDTEFLDRGFLSHSLISMLHEPDFVRIQPTQVSLQVSGHSHGGQICMPGGIPIHTPYGGRDYVAGYFPDAKVPLFVTRGVGTTGPQWRLFCRPEVSVLTLRS